MKNWIHYIGNTKFLTGIYFLAFMVLGSIAAYLRGIDAFSIVFIWQVAGLSAVFGLLHYIQLSHLSPLIRISLHVLLSYGVLATFSLLCGWGFTAPDAFWTFTCAFIILYIIIFLAFTWYYKNEAHDLNRKLEDYKKETK